LSKNITPSKLQIGLDSGEFMKTCWKETSEDFTLVIFKKFANPLIMGETVTK
jgi:hypothetical protein